MKEEIEKQIEEALEKATPGPWIKRITMSDVEVYDPTDTYPLAILDFKNSENDAHLIANTTEWLRHLLSIISQKDEEIEHISQVAKRAIEIVKQHHSVTGNDLEDMLEDKPHVNP